MLDFDDVSWFAVLFPVIGPISAVLLITGIIVMGVIAYQNENECETRACAAGMSPRLMDSECLCVALAHAKAN